MYNMFRNEFALRIDALDDAAKDVVMNALDATADGFMMSMKQTAMVAQEWQLPRIVYEYIAIRKCDGLAEGTLKCYMSVLSAFFGSVRKMPKDVMPNDVRMYLYRYQTEKVVSNRTLDRIRTVICTFFGWAVNEGYFDSNPCRNVRHIKYAAKPREALTQIELEQMRMRCVSDRDTAILEVMYSTGCRVSELVRLKKCDVNFDTREVQLFGKGSKYRTSYLNARAVVALRVYLEKRSDGCEYVFVTERGKAHAVTSRCVEDVISRIGADVISTGKKVSPHIIRHSMATQAMRTGMNPATLQRVLGHNDINTTMIYAHVDGGMVQGEHRKFVV